MGGADLEGKRRQPQRRNGQKEDTRAQEEGGAGLES